MSTEAHLKALNVKREELKATIATEMARSSPNFPLITRLKKQNLRLKEEMQHLFLAMKASATG